ncbi:MAG: hypothetical protein EB084_09380 [Proteobacteria bacterium]|nr:hypothetical protein [Pseudomonadota bacterium]
MPKTLNLDNLTQPPETEGNPWSTLVFDTGENGLSGYAAHDAIKTLALGWQDDNGANRTFVLETLLNTIRALSQYYWGLKIVFQHEDLNAATAALAERAFIYGNVTRADTERLGATADALYDLKKQSGLSDEEVRALIESAFAPTAKEEAGAA